jgi:acyl dehydratase
MLSFQDVSVGDELPTLEKQITMPRMMAYGAATWDFIRIHYDADYVRALGFDGPFMDGQMIGGFLAQQLQDWAGPGAFLRKLSFSNRAMVYPGDSVTCHGIVSAKFLENGQALVTCDLWAINQNDEKVVQPASALVRFTELR